MRQIILISDGCSNEGINPVVAASHAREEGIVVNVIGVVDHESQNHASAEISDIARAGGGMSQIVVPQDLSKTMQMMTRKTVTQTIQQVVQKELHHILGDTSIEKLSPEHRAEVVEVIEELGETSDLRVALLVDTSASMKSKLQVVEEAARDLMLSLQARQGKSEISVFRFPGSTSKKHELEMQLNWTEDISKVDQLFNKLSVKGTTPTGPALMHLAEFINQDKQRIEGRTQDRIVGETSFKRRERIAE